MRSTALLALLASACTIDSSKLDAIRCNGTCDGPDLECVDGYCVARGCGDFRDCGDGFQFVCESELCRAIDCNTDGNCAGGFECIDGFCAAEQCGPQEDVDGDGYTAVACGGPDCDDDDPDINPGVVEGAVGNRDETCHDLVDNDCDGRADDSDDGCGPCTDDAQCEDGNPCTEDRCSRGSCLSQPLDGNSCDDGDPCTTADTCDVVICRGNAYDCDDGLGCTTDSCDGAGGCDYAVAAGQCLVDGECVADGSPSADDPCLVCDAARANDELSPLPDDSACDDGDDCTTDDVCTAGACGGTVYSCDDGLDCTTDSCDGAGGCTTAVVAGQCAIDGACFDDGDPQPGNVCQVCDAAADAEAWTVDALADPDDGIACTVDTCTNDVETHTPDDGACGGGGQVCAPCTGTVTGCATPPSALTLSCASSSALGGPGADCTLTVTGAVGADACLSCGTWRGITPLAREDFTGCPNLAGRGWTVAGSAACPTDTGLPPAPGVGTDALEAEQATVTLTRRFDTSGLDRVRLCFDTADDSANANDVFEVRIDTDGAFDTVHTETGGPVANVDRLWVTTCLDLDAIDAAAADNADLGVTLELRASGLADNLYLDNVVLEGWTDGTVVPVTLSTADFAACALGGWSPSGDPVECPVAAGALTGRDALAASSSSWSLGRDVDASTICEDLSVGYQLAAEGASAADTTLLSYGGVPAFGTVGQPAAGGALRSIVANLSHLNPDLRFSPTVALTVTATASTNGARLVLDDLTVSGATCEPGTGVVTAAAPVAAGGGAYDVRVLSDARTRAYVACGWAGLPASSGHAAIDFGP